MYETWQGQGFATEGAWGFESPFAAAEDLHDGFGPESVGGQYAGFGTEAGEVETSEAFGSQGFAYGQPFSETGPAFEGEAFPSGLTLRAATGATGEKQEHWDPHHTGLPLLATGPAERSKRLSPNFTVGELVKSGGRYADAARISPALVRLLQGIRDRAGRSVRITSGYRSWARNKQVYAGYGKTATLSRHCSGQAADIRISGMSGLDIAKLAIDVGGPNVGVGIGGNYAHVDVRGTWAVWTYLTGDASKQAIAAIVRHRAQHTGKAGPAPAPPPAPRPPSVPVTPGTTTGGDLVVQRHPVLSSHAGAPPDLILRWNAMSIPAAIDIVVHFHGFSASKAAMNLRSEILPISGLDLTGPGGAGPARTRPTLAILPRGNYYGGDTGRGYSFPRLTARGALRKLIDDSLARFTAQTGISAPIGRLILTGHSGGGAPLSVILGHRDPGVDPDEVFIYDGQYGPADAVIAWARRRIAAEVANPSAVPPALRVFYRRGSKKHPGTQPNSEALGKALCAPLAAPGAARLRPRFRVELTSAEHWDMPRRFGRSLLADAGVDVPAATRHDCSSGGTTESESFAGEYFDPEASAVDFERQVSEWYSEASERQGYEGFDSEEVESEDFEPEDFQTEDFQTEDFQPEDFQTEDYEPEDFEPENFEPENFQTEDYYESEGYEAEGYEAEGYETEGYEAEGYEAEGYETEEYEAEAYEAEEFADYEDESAEGEAEAFLAEAYEPQYPQAESLAWDESTLGGVVLQGEGFPSGATLDQASGATGKDQEHWDPQNAGLPLLATGPSKRPLKLSPNFTVGELAYSGGRHADVARISPTLVRLLQAIRDRAGRPVRITSGYRSWANNKALYASRGKKPTLSRHCSGQAADIRVKGLSGLEIAKIAIDVGGPNIGVGLARTFAHVDVRGSWSVWNYVGGDEGRKLEAAITAHRAARKTGTAPPTPVPPAPKAPVTPAGPPAAGSNRQQGMVPYQSAKGDSKGPQPGALAMRDHWRRNTELGRVGIYVARSIRGKPGTISVHSEGRALDLYANANDPAQKAIADRYIAWLMANAVELQVQYIIWNRKSWSWQRRKQGWRPYKGQSPHTDHVHAELSWEGAKVPSRLFAGGMEGLAAEAWESPDTETEGYESEAYETGGYETGSYETEGYETEGYETDRYETDRYETEGFETETEGFEGHSDETFWEGESGPAFESETAEVTNVCGFFAPTVPTVTVAAVRARVVAVARAEQTLWRSSTNALQDESVNAMFGHLVRYWLAESARIPAANLVVINARTPNTTYGPTLLGAAAMAAATVNNEARRIARLLIRSLPEPGSPANLETLVIEAIKAARRSKLDQIAWSAAFVNSCVRRAGMNLNLQALAGGGEESLLKLSPLGRHWEYLLEAHRRRFGCRTSPTTFDASCKRTGTYQAFRITEFNPRAGDIIVQDRQANTVAGLLTFDRIPGLTGLEMHADIVVDVQPGFAETIGGNVGGTVRRRRYPLTAAGALVVSPLRLFVGQRTNGTFPAIPAALAAAPAPVPSESTARIVALLRPVQECRKVVA
jgi:uncharacterized protein YcbK (DUF882 family)